MKNLLIINFFHSSQHDVGAIRTQRFAQYLPTFGWKPYILTKFPSKRISGKTYTELDNTFYVPTIPLNKPFHLESLIWIPLMLKKAVEILRKIQIAVLLISCPPFHQAMAGILLKKWFGTKLVIDYRDAWGLNPYRQRLSSFRRFVLQGDKLLEHYLLRKTNLLIVSHQEMKERYLRQFNFLKGRIEVVYNGFDPEKIKSLQETLFSQFTILHLGNFYAKQKTRDPSLFLSATQRIISEKKIPIGQFQVIFIGERYSEVEEMITNKELSAYVSCLDRVSHDAAMEYLNKSHVLLLIEALDVMTTKVYEYLATGKPMLCLIRQGGELEAFIRKFSSEALILPNDIKQIKEAIWTCFKTYQAGPCHGPVNNQFRNSFTRMEQTKLLAESLDRMESSENFSHYREVKKLKSY
jgi:glycosyltransferase involved in cell wall biosynthesis